MSNSVFKQCVEIRVIFLVFQCMSDHLLPDHVSDGFVPPAPLPDSERPLDALVWRLLGGLRRWDALYMLHVAEHGYTHENTLAFLPALPCLASLAARPLLAGGDAALLSPAPALLLTAVVLNLLLSALAAQALYYLGVQVLRDELLAHTAALLFCISPATAFFLAPYSEPLFAMLSFTGMLLCEQGLLWGAAAAFGFASITRSNGVLLAGYVLYRLLVRQLGQMFPSPIKENIAKPSTTWLVCCGVWRTVLGSWLSLLCCIGFILYQLYAFVLYCSPSRLNVPLHVENYVLRHRLVAPGDMTSPWCNQSMPFSYGYVQSHYWDVGFLRYFTLRQLPNFLLAAPAVALTLHGAATYTRAVLRRGAPGGGPPNYRPLPYVLHAVALTVLMVTCAHVQVTTRVLCAASPVFYWFAARLVVGPVTRWQVGCTRKRAGGDSSVVSCLSRPVCRNGQYVQLYFLTYSLLGTVAFVNNLPWT